MQSNYLTYGNLWEPLASNFFNVTEKPYKKAWPTIIAALTAKITFILKSLSAVQIYDFHTFTAVFSPLHGFIWNQYNNQSQVALLAQLVERCTGIAEVMGSNSVQAWIFNRPYFHYRSSGIRHYEDHFLCYVFFA